MTHDPALDARAEEEASRLSFGFGLFGLAFVGLAVELIRSGPCDRHQVPFLRGLLLLGAYLLLASAGLQLRRAWGVAMVYVAFASLAAGTVALFVALGGLEGGLPVFFGLHGPTVVVGFVVIGRLCVDLRRVAR